MTATTLQLLKPHTDAGVDYPPDAVLEVDDTTAAWLVKHGIAQPVPDAAPAAADTPAPAQARGTRSRTDTAG